MLDMHLHVWEHQPGTPVPTLEHLERYCEAASQKGISQIAITEHSYRFTRISEQVLPHWQRQKTGALAEATDHALSVEGGGDLDAYVGALQSAQDQGLPILIGLEVDYWPGAMPATAELLSDYPFDVLLGSVHWLDNWLFDDYRNETFARIWNQRDTDEVYSDYVDAILELVNSKTVDVLAHLDVIKVAGYKPERQAEHEQRLVEGIRGSQVVVEFSSSGLHKPAAETYPGPTLLDALVQAGIDVTTASDAHTPAHVGRGFDVLSSELNSRGIRELTTFDRRRKVPHSLTD